MTDELVKRHIEQLRLTGGDLADLCQPLADAIEYLIAERDRLRVSNMQMLGDIAVAMGRIDALTAERDYTEGTNDTLIAMNQDLTEERDAAYARGYSDAETEISKSALGQKNDFFHFQYANAVNRCDALTAERDRLRGALAMIDAIYPDEHQIDGCALPVVRGLVLRMGETARAALNGETP